MHNTCGMPVHNLSLNLVELPTYTHNTPTHTKYLVELLARYTPIYTQLCIYMCTAYLHILSHITSVRLRVVHIIHIAYKKEFNLRKGTI